MSFKKFHKFMKRGRLHKVIKASGIKKNSSEPEVRVLKTYPGEYVGGPRTQVKPHSDDSDDSWMTQMARANRVHVTIPLEGTPVEFKISHMILFSLLMGTIGIGLITLLFILIGHLI